jgi:hypothetical protein
MGMIPHVKIIEPRWLEEELEERIDSWQQRQETFARRRAEAGE